MSNFLALTSGGTRYVLFIGNLVFKFPRLDRFTEGLEQNNIEWRDRNKSSFLAKLYFSFPLGLCNIMERIEAFPPQNFGDEGNALIRNYYKDKVSSKELEFLLEDGALRNFGMKDGIMLKLDWGGYGFASK